MAAPCSSLSPKPGGHLPFLLETGTGRSTSWGLGLPGQCSGAAGASREDSPSASVCAVIHWDGKVYTQRLLWSPGPDRTGSGLCFLQSWNSTTTPRVGQMLHFNSTTTVQVNWQVRGHLIFPLFLCPPPPFLLQPLSHCGESHTFTILAWAQLF